MGQASTLSLLCLVHPGTTPSPRVVAKLKVLLSWQEAPGQEVAFHSTLIRGAKTTTSPKLVFRQ